jgi:sortase A
VRHVLRFAASVMIVSGVLLITDAGITLAWQEPISAYLNARQQDQLEDELADPANQAEVVQAFRTNKKPLQGDAIGRIELPSIDKRYYLVEGTDTDSLTKGPGHYEDTPLPGQRGTVGIAGHRTTHGAPFRNIDDLSRGDEVLVDMPYATFEYRVEKTRIVEPTQTEVKRKVGYDRLILSACHPLYSAAERIVVFAKFVRRLPARVTRS